MLDNGFRHLPVVDGSNVLGVVSLRRVLGGRRQPTPKPRDPGEACTKAAPAAAERTLRALRDQNPRERILVLRKTR